MPVATNQQWNRPGLVLMRTALTSEARAAPIPHGGKYLEALARIAVGPQSTLTQLTTLFWIYPPD
jgi:hypothetical protein